MRLRFLARIITASAVFLLLPVLLNGKMVASGAWAQSSELMKEFRQYEVLNNAGKYSQAIPHALRALELGRKKFGPEHKNVGIFLHNLAALYWAEGSLVEAEPLYKRSLRIREKLLGQDHPDVGGSLNGLALLYKYQGRYKEAESLYRRSLRIYETALGPEHSSVGLSLNNLAGLYDTQGRYVEAEPLYRRSLKIYEKTLGSDHPDVGRSLNNLAMLYLAQGRYSEVEPLVKRSLRIREKALGPSHPDVGQSLNNLAELYRIQGRYAEAEPFYKRDLAISEKALGPDHPSVATSLSNFALLYRLQGYYDEAEPLYRRSLRIREKALGPDHPAVAISVNNLAMLYLAQGRNSEGEPLALRGLRIREKALGSDHPRVGGSLNNLALLYFVQSNWRQAASYWRRATGVLTRRAIRAAQIGRGTAGAKKSAIAQKSGYFQGLVKSVFRIGGKNRQASSTLKEMFETAQWATGSTAAGALAQMSARQAAGSGKLAAIMRERQDSLSRWQTLEKRMNALRGAGKRDEKLEAEMTVLDRRISEIDKKLAKEFPDYAALVSPKPLAVTQVQKLLAPDEALILLLDTPKAGTTPPETFIWAVTRERAVWKRARLGGKALAKKVAKLRCGLDASNWTDPSLWPNKSPWDIEARATQQARRDKCIRLMGKSYADQDWPPFDFKTAHELYQKLFAPVERVIKGKKLLVVASGSLTGLPMQVLVTKKFKGSIAKNGVGYGQAAWLIKKHALTTLPSVSSLKALRGITRNAIKAPHPLIGFGDPIFSQPSTKPARRAANRAAKGGAKLARISKPRRSVLRNYASFFKGRNANLATLAQSLPQLDGTRRELLAVGKILGVGAKDVLLGRNASEEAVKKADLKNYRIVYFATHGLIAGDVEGLGEPALAFSLPAKATPLDDGLLTASEVTSLKLNADWVVMSACNTASGSASGGASGGASGSPSGDKPGAEALSGLARAFFYAGAKTLLVSHWPVGDTAAIALTTHAFKTMHDNPKLGRAEAMRRSMLALLKESGFNAHPTVWAPFVVVGEGAAIR